MMKAPRCGIKDNFLPNSNTSDLTRHKRYSIEGSKWKNKDLTYKITKYPPKLDKTAVDKELKRALQAWADVSGLTFQQKQSGKVNIDVRFVKREHGDGDPLDGPGGVLAHAFFPLYGGDAHFDSEEKWTIESYKGTNILQVAAHEFGHALGLAHSSVSSSLMAPFYKGYDPNFSLTPDDIQGIQALYGKPAGQNVAGSGDSGSGTDPDGDNEEAGGLCGRVNIDTIFSSADGDVYVFKGDEYWLLTDFGVADGYPKLIADYWQDLPGDIDAAFTGSNRKTYFFKDVSSIPRLEAALHEAWNNIPPQTLRNLCESLPTWLRDVIKRKGRSIKY
ncbi:stromelysin-3-like [Cherax quadricarinatus]|uniref:stromelysin-3-like n=1 Tax=Cherax quadricarinatus TaxID=27406 RepID=UPI00387E5F2B